MSRFKDKSRLKVLKNEVASLKAKTASLTRNAALLIYIKIGVTGIYLCLSKNLVCFFVLFTTFICMVHFTGTEELRLAISCAIISSAST